MPTPRFIYTDHVLERMAQRRISKAEVEQCVMTATTTFRTRGGIQYRAVVGQRRIKVVTIAKSDTDRRKVIKTAADEDQEDES